MIKFKWVKGQLHFQTPVTFVKPNGAIECVIQKGQVLYNQWDVVPDDGGGIAPTENPCSCVPDSDNGKVAHLCEWHREYQRLQEAARRFDVNRRRLNDKMVEVIARHLHYFEAADDAGIFTTIRQVNNAFEGGSIRYTHDAQFRTKVDSICASIANIVDAEVERFAADGGGE